MAKKYRIRKVSNWEVIRTIGCVFLGAALFYLMLVMAIGLGEG